MPVIIQLGEPRKVPLYLIPVPAKHHLLKVLEVKEHS